MKTRKIRLLSALLALAMLLALLPTAAFAETSGDYEYSVNAGNVTITKYIGSGGTVVIPAEIDGKPVIAIGKEAFYGCSSVTAVTIPDSVESIGEDAFSGYADRELETPRITEIKIPSGVKTIGNFAFAYCDELKTVDLSQAANLETIGVQAFSDCAGLTDVKLNGAGNLRTIESGAFVRSGVKQIEIPNSVEKIEARAFYKCPLQSVTFAEVSQLKTVGVKAFAATQLDSIVIPASVQTLESEEGFSPTGSSTDHWEGAFYCCGQLQSVTFKPDSQLTTVGKGAFDECHANLVIYYSYSDESVKQALTNAGVSADKIKLTNPTVTFDSNDGSAVAAQKVEYNTPVAEPTAPTKEGYIFAGWYTDGALTEKYDFSNAVTDDMTLYAKWNVGGNCGVGGDLTWTLDGGTLTISGSGAMTDYIGPNEQPWAKQRSSINKVVIGGGVTSVGKQAFTDCSQLSTVELPQNGALKTINESAFGRLDSSSEVGAGITEITIPESVKRIEMCAFNGCTKLATVTFAPNSQLEAIHSWAFQDTAISEISIPASVEIINWDVFNGCSNLTKVIFESPSKLDTVHENAFSGCDNLQTVYYDGNNDGVKQSLQSQLGEKFKNGWTVKFETEGGSEVAQQNVKNSQTATKPTDPTKEGYKFGGWYDGDTKFDFDTPITKDTTLTAQWQLPEAPVTYKLTVTDGTAWVNGEQVTEAAKGDIVTIEASETALEGMAFERWEVRKGEVKLENDRAAETTFTMPAGEVQLEAMYQAADANDSGWDAATVVTGAVIGTGTAILAYHIGMEVYAEQVLGKDVAVPRTRGEVALLAWQLAGSPAVNVEGEPLSEAAQAERWAVESGLMQPDAEGNFNGTKKMSKWNALRTLDAAKKMG